MAPLPRSLLALVVSFVVADLTFGEEGWRTGRATYYGIEWSLHDGSCGYGQLDPTRNTGYDVAAISTLHYEYSGSCGTCYEIKCENMNFGDNYGNYLERSDACYDTSTTLVVAIVDSCPCEYAANAYSNKRWCCQDMDHLDISYSAFEKLADRKWGVIGLKYRPVQCPDETYLEKKDHYPPDNGRKMQSFGRHVTEDGAKMLILDDGVTKFDLTLRDYVRRARLGS